MTNNSGPLPADHKLLAEYGLQSQVAFAIFVANRKINNEGQLKYYSYSRTLAKMYKSVSFKSKRSRVCSVAHPLLTRDIILFAGFWWQMFPPVTPPAQKTTNFNWFLVKISLFLLF